MNGRDRILRERARQIHAEGYTSAHDDGYVAGELADAAEAYEQHAYSVKRGRALWTVAPARWPWVQASWKPSPDTVRNLEKAGALYLAELERLNRRWSRTSSPDRALIEEEMDRCHSAVRRCARGIDSCREDRNVALLAIALFFAFLLTAIVLLCRHAQP